MSQAAYCRRFKFDDFIAWYKHTILVAVAHWNKHALNYVLNYYKTF